MNNIFRKMNINEILNLMDSNIDKNVVVSGIDENLMCELIKHLSTDENLNNGNFLIDMNLEEINYIEYIISLILNKYCDHSMDDFETKLNNELLKKENLLTKDVEERKIVKQRIDLLKALIKVTGDIRISQPITESLNVSNEYIVGKLLKAYSVNSKLFNLLKVKNYDIKEEHYKYLFNLENKELMHSLFNEGNFNSIIVPEEKRFTWLLDGLMPFNNLRDKGIINCISNFQNVSDITLQKSLSDIIKKTTDTMRYVIFTSSSTIETHKLFKQLDGYGYEEFSLVRNK